jgi:heptosyltransferase II
MLLPRQAPDGYHASTITEESLVSQKLAVFMPNWVGDAVMATPTLRALSKRMENGGSLVGVMQPVVAQLLSGTPWFTDQINFRKRGWSSRLRLALQLRAARPDAILLLTNSLWTAVVAKLAGVKRRIGYARDGRGWLLTDSLPALKKSGKFTPVPAVDYYLQLASYLGCEIDDRRVSVAVEAADEQLAIRLWDQLRFQAERPLVVINSSGAWGAAKLWPADHVEQLARRLVDNHPWQVLLHCGPAEREAADAVASRINHSRVQSMGRADQLPIGLTKAVMARAAAVVSTDSGPRHIAVALDRPVIGLFGPTDPAWTRTYNVPEMELGLHMACRGCWKKSCPLEHNRCMRDLGIETVYGAVVTAISHSARRAA